MHHILIEWYLESSLKNKAGYTAWGPGEECYHCRGSWLTHSLGGIKSSVPRVDPRLIVPNCASEAGQKTVEANIVIGWEEK